MFGWLRRLLQKNRGEGSWPRHLMNTSEEMTYEKAAIVVRELDEKDLVTLFSAAIGRFSALKGDEEAIFFLKGMANYLSNLKKEESSKS